MSFFQSETSFSKTETRLLHLVSVLHFRSIPIYFFSCFIVLFITSCGKDKITLPITEQLSPTQNHLAAVAFVDEKTGCAVGGDTWVSGEILSTTDGGLIWKIDTTVNQKLFAIQFDRQGTARSAGLSGNIFEKKAGESHWHGRRQDFKWYRSIDFWDENRGLTASGEGYVNGLVRLFGPGYSVESDSIIMQEMEAIQFTDSLTAHASGYGTVLRSADGGQTWTRLDVDGDFFLNLHFPTAAVGYIIGMFGTILKTENGGLDWQEIRGGGNGITRIHFTAVHFVDEKKGYIVGESGLFWKTIDGGDNWLEVENAPDDLDFTDVFCRENEGWLVGSNGRIFHFQD